MQTAMKSPEEEEDEEEEEKAAACSFRGHLIPQRLLPKKSGKHMKPLIAHSGPGASPVSEDEAETAST